MVDNAKIPLTVTYLHNIRLVGGQLSATLMGQDYVDSNFDNPERSRDICEKCFKLRKLIIEVVSSFGSEMYIYIRETNYML